MKAIETLSAQQQQAAQQPDFFNVEEPVRFFAPQDDKTLKQMLKLLSGLQQAGRASEVLLSFANFEEIWRVVFKFCIVESKVLNWIS